MSSINEVAGSLKMHFSSSVNAVPTAQGKPFLEILHEGKTIFLLNMPKRATEQTFELRVIPAGFEPSKLSFVIYEYEHKDDKGKKRKSDGEVWLKTVDEAGEESLAGRLDAALGASEAVPGLPSLTRKLVQEDTLIALKAL